MGCGNIWVSSKNVEVDLITLPIPAITLNQTKYCNGDIATLSLNIPKDPSYAINWYRDNTLIAADQNFTSVQTTTGGLYQVV